MWRESLIMLCESLVMRCESLIMRCESLVLRCESAQGPLRSLYFVCQLDSLGVKLADKIERSARPAPLPRILKAQ